MANSEEEITGRRSTGELLSDLLEMTNRQSDVNMKLRAVLEPVVKAYSRDKPLELTAETVNEIESLFIDTESLQAERRAVFHELFGTEADLPPV